MDLFEVCNKLFMVIKGCWTFLAFMNLNIVVELFDVILEVKFARKCCWTCSALERL
jgi:hypothetical protein